ncbi:MAG: response regulator, partial [Deltaproteobacteria bacterium]|nr:response regulator [Deltaproteobacteria bacterium]
VHTMLGKMLRREGYTVASAHNAEEAFTAIAQQKPDLMILDIMMPRVSGIEVCNRVKADPTTKDISILIISARDAQADRLEGLEHGADDYVSKPFHLKSLVRKIDHMLTKKHG